MGKRKLVTGVVIGAAAGGLMSLLDKETRAYAKEKVTSARSGASYLVKNPSEAIRKVRTAFDTFNQAFAKGAENTINALDQAETTLDKITNKRQIDRIE
ncbi:MULTISPECIES: hypothetical protein [Virgibacillus]|uniref:Gas vesicle protein n=1 Tax=Virgibacillus pantothenticus TaxID=1473 RepID=A0A0L0QUZ6_VIRPA|nr:MULTISPECIES: hypothetical protein [Virgibacillus]API91313.1 hypothetical protein BKP57_05325 [Virgibacillus sp. 6R]KNE22500.1 hypothetical protein AFK71_02470 [Virgibacillus pantothenticus]MBS7426546.1 YtxH domain-containing protein [Virgibacillus sp. 19R1-5]MBU8567269.1 YtxH domain-containing protein [Virgibacillus pantothenticus]MBU8600025.1 YtxH domain-containing protein [Virgibacillus pantothenticus]